MNVAIMGYGTIGSGVAEILERDADTIERRLGFPLKLKKILDNRDLSDTPVAGIVTADYMEIVNDKDIDIVVETMGGVEPAFTFVKAMLEAGKHVTTSNKALVADKGPELMKLAKDKNVNFLFEAAVGGGIPIIRPLAVNLAGDEIDLIEGIVNGTTNFILTRMKEDGLAFDDALKEAQQLGYAEADPTNDIEGYDATRKIAILTSIAANKKVDFNEIPCKGITGITAKDIEYANKLHMHIKLLARAQRVGDTYSIEVAPFMIYDSHPLSMVTGVFNAICVRGNMLGDSMYYGSGAGKLPTASAVVGDIVDMARNSNHTMYTLWGDDKIDLCKEGVKCDYFIRCKDGIEKVQEAFGEDVVEADIDIDGETAFFTGMISKSELEAGKNKLSDVISCIGVA